MNAGNRALMTAAVLLASGYAWAGGGLDPGAYTDKHMVQPYRHRASDRAVRADRAADGARGSGYDMPAGLDDERSRGGRHQGGAGDDNQLVARGGSTTWERAIRYIAPGDCWEAHVESSLRDDIVTWGPGRPWAETLVQMGDDHGAYVSINRADCMIGVATEGELAEKLARIGGDVWRIRPGSSLKQTLTEWARRAGWELSWQWKYDYTIEHSATLVGDFHGSDGTDGVLAMVIRSYRDYPTPLQYEFKRGNPVVIVRAGGNRIGGSR